MHHHFLYPLRPSCPHAGADDVHFPWFTPWLLVQKLGLWREIEERRFREIFQASGSEEVDRNLRQTDKERRSVPGRQVGDGGGAWEENKVWLRGGSFWLGREGFIHPLSHPPIRGGDWRMNKRMHLWMKCRMNILSDREDAVFAKQRERVIQWEKESVVLVPLPSVILKWSPRLYNNKVCTRIHEPFEYVKVYGCYLVCLSCFPTSTNKIYNTTKLVSY